MKLLEIIELRSIKRNKKKVELQLKKIIFELNKKSLQNKITLYKHATVDTDFSIHIHYDSNETLRDKNSIGIQLVFLLKKIGLVNHSVWVEKCSTKLNPDC